MFRGKKKKCFLSCLYNRWCMNVKSCAGCHVLQLIKDATINPCVRLQEWDGVARISSYLSICTYPLLMYFSEKCHLKFYRRTNPSSYILLRLHLNISLMGWKPTPPCPKRVRCSLQVKRHLGIFGILTIDEKEHVRLTNGSGQQQCYCFGDLFDAGETAEPGMD